MIQLTILIAIAAAICEARSEELPAKHNKFWVRLIMPILVGVVTLNPLLGALALVTFYMVFDPLRNRFTGYDFFYSDEDTWKRLFQGQTSLYDVVNGRIVLMIEVFLFIVLIMESL